MFLVTTKLMNNVKKNKFDSKFFENVSPLKLTEGRRMKLHTESWGLLTEYELESVKITSAKGNVHSCATIRISDRSGQVTCAVRGPTVGLLFGLSPQEWSDVEKLCKPDQQLFYRYFNKGLNTNFRYEQRLFYNFCMCNKKSDVLVAVFRRCVNMRNKDRGDAFLEIIELKKCNNNLLDLYIIYLRENCDVEPETQLNIK